MHVDAGQFETTLDLARAAGFTVRQGPAIGWSRTAMLERGSPSA